MGQDGDQRVAGDGIADLQRDVLDFCRRRGWTDECKSLAMSVAIEAAEIMEIFQWKAAGEPLRAPERDALALECADVLWYLLRLCAAQGIPLAEALRDKIRINEGRFPERAEAPEVG